MFALLFLLLFAPLFAGEPVADLLTPDLPTLGEAICIPCVPTEYCNRRLSKENVRVDLIDPLYSQGALTTDQGGIITGQDLRVQAKKIHYLQNETQCSLYCEGDLLIDYKEWTLTGTAFFYDFVTSTGYLLDGKTAAPPWYIGSKRMELLANGEIVVRGGYLTTSEGPRHDIRLSSPHIRLAKNKIAAANDVTLLVKKIPLLWVPSLKVDLNTIEQTPLAFQFGWGGFLASHISVLYKFLNWNDLEALARVDGFFKYGVGGGIDTIYNPKHRCTEFYTRNYYAHDLPLQTPDQKNRWRYQGTYADKFSRLKISAKAKYDFVSDAQMAAQYNHHDFALKTAGRTELELRRQDPWWIANLYTRVRVNNFQSVNQQLPSFKLDWRSFEVPHTGVIVSGKFSAEYLHYIFGKQITDNNNFHSSRIALTPLLYRPFKATWLTFTPELGGRGIYYNENENGSSIGQAELFTGAKLETVFHKTFANRFKHAAQPYIHYHYLTVPAVSDNDHYIFSIEDGLGAVSRFRFGLRNSLFLRDDCSVNRRFWFDIWGNLFLKSNSAFPDQKGYLNAEYIPYPNLAFAFFGGWNFSEHMLDFANPRVDWTPSENLAFSLECRHRNKYYWRKADFYNFVLENVRSETELLNSALSDRRTTLLFRTFLRLNPEWDVSFDIRKGWNRKAKTKQLPYLEWVGELGAVVFDHWRFNFIYEKRESDNRYSISLRMDPGPPKKAKFCPRF
ncbi:MAG: hypothetical protein S4CHLAM45_09290 [Chlamydiales bacterium]|nr:hypothetical protein [Chlamydiales bacterium]MCH9620080.1 hypothetical protein [Chlamydiales bacterium]MCH9623033.1 hypothetical protein [Chlamydiales bacterium]